MKRIMLLVIALFASSSSLSAQATSDVAVWVTGSKFEDPSLFEEDEIVSFEFDEKVGYGVSFNHFWTRAFSTEFAYHTFGADLDVGIDGGPRLNVGEVDASSLTGVAQWHFRRATRFSPYVGAGLAYIQGEFKGGEEVGESFSFEPDVEGVVNAGANIAITDSLAVGVDVKHIAWMPKAEDDEEAERLDVSPILVSAGLRYRF
ncbi:MAG TPA: OmpW family outer membrane protein [Thermoanaerobaculia bacterium]|nr:OmpW family outer membrane protein [Thermoanaerobaculia bacterium]